MSIDLAPLWNYSQPEASEQRFRAAMAGASGDDVLILQTQIARTQGLRRQFHQARALLQQIEPAVQAAGPEARARHALELGRTHCSATHAAEERTPAAREQARRGFEAALAIARSAQLDALAIDAIHMLAFVDPAPVDQLQWGEQALAVVLASSQPEARRWEASVRNNLGYALHQLGRYPEALSQFEQAVLVRRQGSDAPALRVAQWMVAWTLHAMNRIEEALTMQLQLERDNDAAGQPDAYVFEELEKLYRVKGDAGRSLHYATRKASALR